MNDIHMRAILLIVIAALNIGGAWGLRVGNVTGIFPSLMALVGLAAFIAAGWLLLFAEPASSPQERRE